MSHSNARLISVGRLVVVARIQVGMPQVYVGFVDGCFAGYGG